MTCPQCGAPLPRDARRRAVTCEHCGSRLGPEVSETSEPTRPEPATDDTGRSFTFPTVPTRTYYRYLLGLVPTLIAYGAYVLMLGQWQPGTAQRRPAPTGSETMPTKTTPRDPPPTALGPLPRLLPGLLLVPSAHAGDAENLVAVVEEPGPQRKRWLGKLDGMSGEPLWRWPLDAALVEAPRAAIEGMLVMVGASTVQALDLESGQVAWSRDTGGRPDSLCSGDGYAGLSFPNRRFVAFSVATGESVKGRPDACARAFTSQSIAPNFSMLDGKAPDPPLPSRAPLEVQRTLVPHKGTARVALGTDGSGLARVAVATRSDWLWSARLGRGDANRARLLAPALAAVRNERVVVPYVLVNPAELRLASFELASGRLVWDELLTKTDVETRSPLAELRVAREGTIYFANGKGQLWVVGFDSQSIWKMGER